MRMGRAALPRLRQYETTESGALAEWVEPWEVHDRHISHLYGCHPAHEIMPKGEVRGLAAHGGRTVDLAGKDGRATAMTVKEKKT